MAPPRPGRLLSGVDVGDGRRRRQRHLLLAGRSRSTRTMKARRPRLQPPQRRRAARTAGRRPARDRLDDGRRRLRPEYPVRPHAAARGRHPQWQRPHPVRGLVATTVDRTVADCLRYLPPRRRCASPTPLSTRGVDAGGLAGRRRAARRAGRTPHARERRSLLVDGRRESAFESRSAVVFHRLGLPTPSGAGGDRSTRPAPSSRGPTSRGSRMASSARRTERSRTPARTSPRHPGGEGAAGGPRGARVRSWSDGSGGTCSETRRKPSVRVRRALARGDGRRFRGLVA